MEDFSILPLSQEMALEIATEWKYPAPYDFYDATADPEDYAELVSEEARGDHFFAMMQKGVLVGYFCVFPIKTGLELGLGMKPSLTGLGMAELFIRQLKPT